MVDSFDNKPLVFDNPEQVTWRDSTDVLVVGFGGAGACAALQAREEGAEVMILDRFDGGGTTEYSGGVLYAGGTRFQAEAGYDDNPDKMYAYLSMEVGDAVKEETLRTFCQQSGSDVDWLVSKGVQYGSTVYDQKTTFPPEGKYLYYSGNEKTPEYASRTPPIPRGHRAVGKGLGGQHYFGALRNAVAAENIRVGYHHKVTRLVVDSGGAVLGVEVAVLDQKYHEQHQNVYRRANPQIPFRARAVDRIRGKLAKIEQKHSQIQYIRAQKGVVLATGGFAHNPDLFKKHEHNLSCYFDSLHRLASVGSDGSGIALGCSVGAGVAHMDSAYAAVNIAPPNALLNGILVNENGQRFINEEAYSGFIGLAIARQPRGRAYLILPGASFWRAVRESFFGGMHVLKLFGGPALINFALGKTRRAASSSALARKIDVAESGLQQAIADHDSAINSGEKDAIGKSERNRRLLGGRALYGINLSISNPFAITYFMTLGGLCVDENTGAVLTGEGDAIKGLYAAGLCASGIHSNGYLSGISLADGVFSGKRAGRSCARRDDV